VVDRPTTAGAPSAEGRTTIRIGGACGYWGDAAMATPQLLAAGDVDYLVYDYLAEVTMSILARARAKDAAAGFAADFVTAAMAPNLAQIARQGVRVISNAGGVNPQACAESLRVLIRAANLPLSVAVVAGDDLLRQAPELAVAGLREMFSGEPFPAPERIASINAYLGALPIAAALAAGADIVVTGRCVDSAVTLAACIHEFGWAPDDYDRLAAGSLAGHILECGTQATGGNFTDWESVVDTLADAGYPIAEIAADGSFVCTKPDDTGGTVTVGTVAEQLLYEIGDPRAYVLPDVTCDFSGVRLRQLAPDRVHVAGACGRAPTATYKVSATHADGFRGGEMWTVYGRGAERKARKIADNALTRARRALQAQGLGDFTETSVEIVGAETHYGAAREPRDYREVQLKIAARHPSQAGIGTLFREVVGSALAAPPGLTGFAGGRPQPSPVVRLFSFLWPKERVAVAVEVDGRPVPYAAAPVRVDGAPMPDLPWPALPPEPAAWTQVPLERLAWARSGDKGNHANVGVIARDPAYLPWLCAALTEARVAGVFAHFGCRRVERFLLPGMPALNFLLHDVLGGGGVASLRCDPQGKGYAQLLLAEPVRIPIHLLETGA
jgi:Acyclic terpene utilisation family protein AtuA